MAWLSNLVMNLAQSACGGLCWTGQFGFLRHDIDVGER